MATFGTIGGTASIKEVQRRINEKFDNLFHFNSDGVRDVKVCTFCDEILMCWQNMQYLPISTVKKYASLFKWESHYEVHERHQDLEDAFCFEDNHKALGTETQREWLKGLGLSSRGHIGRNGRDARSKWGFSCCNTCKNNVTGGKMPFYAIVNRNGVGHPPKCLTDLTPLELSLVSPVKGYGYCFNLKGGPEMSLQGSMTFMRVQPRKIARGAAQLEGLGLKNHVVVVLSGKMTPSQKLRAKRKVRVEKLIEAVEWLCANNTEWKDITVDEYRETLKDTIPVVIDNSEEVESVNANTEKSELFRCYFPDGSIDENNGGFDNHESFKEYVDEMQKKQFNVSLKFDLCKEFVQGSEAESLTRCCLLQFPYGQGGINERRELPTDGSFTNESDLDKFMDHLSRLSQPIFHHPMFLLVAYSMSGKMKLLKRSRLQVKGEHSASAIANGLDHLDIRAAMHGQANGDYNAGTVAAKNLLKAVKATSKALPHTNEAAKAARSNGESLQHHFGIGSIWLTVTFDDENSLPMQAMAREHIDSLDVHPNTLTLEDLEDQRGRRKNLRVKYPGLTAVNFEMLLSIVMEEVVGWNIRTNQPTGTVGLFGIPKACSAAMEEQGRHTVHTHMQVYVEGVREQQKKMFFGSTAEKRMAYDTMIRYNEHISTTSLFEGTQRQLQNAFDHECSGKPNKFDRPLPKTVDDQGLRDLRHKKGYEERKGKFATCPACTKVWTYEQLVEDYVRNYYKMSDGHVRCEGEPDCDKQGVPKANIPKARMLAEIMQYQMTPNQDEPDKAVSGCINACYQHHSSYHHCSCFKCNKLKKSKHTCGPKCECRMRLPDRKRKDTFVQEHGEVKPWFAWTGEERQQPLLEFLPKRSKYDLFQNVSCTAISESKMSCNTNVSNITDGPVGQYQFKYHIKETNAQETAEYCAAAETIQRVVRRKWDDDRKESLRLICRASMAHNKKNIIGAPLASYILRNGSRFYFSHTFQYCPLSDLMKLVRNQRVTTNQTRDKKGDVYFENQGLHYLCRPRALEFLSPKDFTEKYRVGYVSKKRKKGEIDLRMQNSTGFFQHPSASPNRQTGVLGVAKQCCYERDERAYVKVPQWMFKDTGAFGVNILTCTADEITAEMDQYANVVLSLMCHYRSIDDLKCTTGNPLYLFANRFREIHVQDTQAKMRGQRAEVFTDDNMTFLQNVQDCAYNCMRYKIGDDDLRAATEPFKSEHTHDDDDDDEDGGEVEVECPDLPYEFLIESLDASQHPLDKDSSALPQFLDEFHFDGIRNRGSQGCGYSKKIPPIVAPDIPVTLEDDFVHYEAGRNHGGGASPDDHEEEAPLKYGIKEVVELLLSSSQARPRPSVFEYNPEAKVPNATGSVESIFEWSKAAKLDKIQRRAFEILVCAFVITFYDKGKDNHASPDVDITDKEKHQVGRKWLMDLLDAEDPQVVMLLHGPGGSGKSTVIDLTVAYAKEYCEHLGHPFTSRTIAITAMSGVAATLIHGETTHGAIGLCLKNKIGPDHPMVGEWFDTRLLIVDECSFACGEDFQKVDTNCRIVKKNGWTKFGGMNVCWAGDFSQLAPPGRIPVYDGEITPQFHNHLTVFVELDGMHRFNKDEAWGHRMLRFREGEPTENDIDVINNACFVTKDRVPPSGIQVATFFNKDRDAINCGLFEKFCKEQKPQEADGVFHGAVMIFMDQLDMHDSKKKYVSVTSNNAKAYFYGTCSESDIKMVAMQAGKCDTILKLYPNCPLMHTQNTDVRRGIANGTRVRLRSVHVKSGEQHFLVKLRNGTTVRGFMASQIKHITVKHEIKDVLPAEFDVVTDTFNFNMRLKLDHEEKDALMHGSNFPLISNSATTGHKLQGYTATTLLANAWEYRGNWAYVVLSRVRTMLGLFLGEKLSYDLRNYEMPENMKTMLQGFRDTILVNFFTDEYYQTLLIASNPETTSAATALVNLMSHPI